jgi:hypothetical protein
MSAAFPVDRHAGDLVVAREQVLGVAHIDPAHRQGVASALDQIENRLRIRQLARIQRQTHGRRLVGDAVELATRRQGGEGRQVVDDDAPLVSHIDLTHGLVAAIAWAWATLAPVTANVVP